MKKFCCMKKQFSLFCVVFLMIGVLWIPMSARAEDTVLTYKLYHKHVAGCSGTVYETKVAENENGPVITYESTCSSCGGYVHDYEYSASCSCGLTWYDDGWACVNSPYGTNQGTCQNYNTVAVDTSHQHPVQKQICGMTENSVIEVIKVKCSTLSPAKTITLTAETENKLDDIKLAWDGYNNLSKITVSENGTYKLYATYSDRGIEYVTELAVKVSNIDKTSPTVSEIKADKTNYTNGKVVLSVTAKDNTGLPENYISWNGGAYGKSNQYEVTANGTYSVTIKDLAGNTVTKSIKISNIDKTSPTVSEIKADKTNYTNGKVILSVTAKDNVGLAENYASWNGGAYGKSNQYEVTANGTYSVTIKDLAGNTVTKSIKISNIDKTAPTVSEIKADKTNYTNGKVVLSVTAKDNVGLAENYASWNGGAYGKSNQYEVTANGTYSVTIKDLAGNTVTKSIKISNIDKTAPTVSEIKADKTEYTNGKVVLSVDASDEVGLAENYASWNGGAYGKSSQYEVTANGTYSVTIKDLAGNTVTKSIKVSNIDKTAPTVSEIKADKTEYTNGKVVLSVDASDEVGLAENYASWNGGAYGKSNQYEVTENGTYTVVIKDLAGNIVTGSIVINNIDMEMPIVSEIRVDKEDATNESITLSIEVTDNTELPEKYINWNDEGYGNASEFEVSDNGIYKVVVRDAAGNTVTKTIEIFNIDRTAPKITSVSTTPTPWYEGKCSIRIEAKDTGDDNKEVALPKEAFSWDGGKTWTSENVYEQSKTGIITVMVKDAAGNTTQAEVKVVKEEKPRSSEKEDDKVIENTNDAVTENENNNVTQDENTHSPEYESQGSVTNEQQAEEKVEKEETQNSILPGTEIEENIVENEPLYEENRPLELETLENHPIEKEPLENHPSEGDVLDNSSEINYKVIWFCIFGGILAAVVLFVPMLYMLFGMCRIYEVNHSGEKKYLGRTGIRYGKKKYAVKISKKIVDKATECTLKIVLPGWFVKINENRPVRIIVDTLVIKKYVEKEIEFYIKA